MWKLEVWPRYSLLMVGVWLVIAATSWRCPVTTTTTRIQGRRRREVSLFAVAPRSGDDDNDDLTKEELALRFAEVRDYYRKSKEMSQEDVCLSMLRTRLPNLRLNRCVLGASTIPQAGLGLFAGRNVAQGELITLYPGDALLLWSGDVGDFVGDVGVMFGKHIVDRNATRVSTDEARSYELKIRTSQSIVADPTLVDDAAYLGHMINDGSALTSRTNASRTEYSRNSFERHNAAFFVMEGCHFTTIATKNIQKGQEIFASYGEGYWLSRSHTTLQPNPKG